MKLERIKNLREDNDLTQQNLAEYLSISRSTYRNYENGDRNIPIEILIKIADFYKVSLDYIVGRSSNKNPTQL